MEEKMADVERKGVRVAPKEWVETQVLRTAEALGETIDYWKGLPRKTKLKLATSFVVPATLGIATAVGAWRFYEGRVELPAIQPVEGKETSLEVSAAQIPPAPEVVIPPEIETAPEVERLPIEVEEKIPSQEVSPKTEVVVSLNLNYTIRPYDTLSEIAKRFGTTQEEILALNEIKDPNLIHPREELIIPEVSVEKTIEFLQNLQNKVDEIYDLRRRRLGIGRPYIVQKGDTLWDIAEKHKISVGKILEINPEIENQNLIFSGQKLRMPEDVVPSETLGEIFNRIDSDFTRLQVFIESGEQNSLEARRTSQEIMEYWNNAPGEKEEVKDPEIIVNPEAENGEWIAGQIREFLKYLPNSGRVAEKIFIVPREFWPDWPFAAGMYTFKDHGAHIYIFEYPIDPSSKEKEEWTESSLIGVFSHEFSHGTSLYSEGYNLGFISPAEVVNLVYQDTAIWDKIYRPRGGEYATFGIEEEEDNAWLASVFLRGKESIFYKYQKPEIIQAKLEFVNYWFSKQLGENIDFIKIGEQLGFR